MLSKRIFISIIVIGCLVQFITCPDERRNDPNNRSKSIKNPQGTEKSGVGKPVVKAPITPRGLPQSNKTEEEKKKQAEATKKQAEADKKKTPETTPDPVNPDKNEDPMKENPVGRLKKINIILGRINEFRKKICPFKFVGRLFRKMSGSNKPKPTDDEKSDP